MTVPEINVSIEQKLKVSLDKNWLKNMVLETLKAEDIITAVEIGLVITDNKTVQELNKTYRDIDEPTDVLAFHMHHTSQETELSFIAPPNGIRHLGEIVISYPQAVKQAQEQGYSTAQELALLIVHGLLHLLGYDHKQPDERQRMKAREKSIMEKLKAIG